MNFSRLVVAVVAGVIVVAGSIVAYRQAELPPAESQLSGSATAVIPDIVPVETGLEIVTAEGVVTPLTHIQLSFQAAGQLAEIFVEEGERVNAGDRLLRLDDRDQQIALVQAQAMLAQAGADLAAAEADLLAAQIGLTGGGIAVAAAEAQLTLLIAGPSEAQIALNERLVDAAQAGVAQAAGNRDILLQASPDSEIQAARARLAAAEADVVLAQISLDRYDREGADGALREQAQLQLNAAVAGATAAQALLDERLAGATVAQRAAANGGVGAAIGQRDAVQAQYDLSLAARPEAIAVMEATVAQAEGQLAEAALLIRQAETAVSQAESRLAEAETAVAAAETALAKMTLTAPFAGTVAQLRPSVGQVVAPAAPAVVLADFEGWTIKTTNLTELAVVTIAPGFPVEVTIDAFPGRRLSGEIVEIAAVSDLVRGDVTYVVTVKLDDTDVALRWGMTAFVTVNVGSQ